MLKSNLILLALPVVCQCLPSVVQHPKRTEGGLHLPLVRRARNGLDLVKRQARTGAIGLGNYMDVVYQVLVKVGSVETPLVLDTGSSDLWVVSDACMGNCSHGSLPLYPTSSFQSEGLDVQLFYGDSRSRTFAFGPMGRDSAGIAGLTVERQVFAAINQTNTSLFDVEAAGIIGLGFPINSVLLSQLFSKQFPSNRPSTKRDLVRPNVNFDPRRNAFTLPELYPGLSSRSLEARQSTAPTVDNLLSTFQTNGPIVARLADQGQLASPAITITLQRGAIAVGGNVGQLSIGELPQGVSNDSLTWVPVRLYSDEQGGIPGPADSRQERYPIAWEAPIDNVYLDGQLLPKSTLSSTTDTVTALVDTGNSLIRGPEDVVAEIYRRLTGSTSFDGTFDCTQPHVLEFEIGGKRFPVDPRDLITQTMTNTLSQCSPNLAPTDPPSTGFLYSWSLGDPFLKSALVSYYYGNLQYPSRDLPRMGFLSTVPADANAQFAQAVTHARQAKNNFPAIIEAAPTGTMAAAGTGVGGVPLAETTRAGIGNTSSALALRFTWAAIFIPLLMSIAL